MGDLRRRWSRTRLFLPSSSAACLLSVSAVAQVPVTKMMYVQPIDVCSDTGTNCAPFNTLSPTGNPSNQDQTKNPIGFIDAASRKDITRVLLNQIGVDVTWLTIKQFDSSKFQTLSVVQGGGACGLGATITGYQSCDLLAISQQPALSKNPNPVYTPTPPLAPQPTVFNLFFVSKLNPPAQQPGTQIYDLVWVGNNGGALGGNTFFPPFPLTARTDVPAHGLMHGLGADHAILGAGPYNPFDPTTNPLGGVAPPIPTNPFSGECDSAYPACMANLMTTGNLRIQPSPACMLVVQPPPTGSSCLVRGVAKPTFSNEMADQLTTEAIDMNSLLPVSQQRYALMSGFLTPIANAPVMASQTAAGGASTAAVTGSAIRGGKASTSAAYSAPTSSSIIFNLSGPTGGVPGDTITAEILILPQGPPALTFDTRNPFRIIAQSRRNLLQDVDVPHPDPDVPYNPCAPATVQCLEVEFNRNPGKGFGPADFIEFSQGILIGGSPITLDELCGAKLVYIFQSGAIITSSLGPCSGSVTTVLTASPQNPDVTTPNQVVNPGTLVTSSNPPCTLDPTTGLCPDPTMTGVEDGNPSEQAQLCYFHGSPVPCP